MRPLYCWNFESDPLESEIERLFQRYGEVDRVEMKTGFALVYMEDEGDAEVAIDDLNHGYVEFQRRPLRVGWTKEDCSIERPTKTLFVVNFDPAITTTLDLEKHFSPFGKLVRVQIRKNFGFVQYETQEEATKARESTNWSQVGDREICVEYARESAPGNAPGRSRI